MTKENGSPPGQQGDEATRTDFEGYFKEKFFDQEFDFEIKLYRITRPRGAEIFSYLRRYENIIPHEESIGEEFGSGKYTLWSQNPMNKEVYTKRIVIDPVWDKVHEQFLFKKEQERKLDQLPFPPAGSPAQLQGPGHENSLNLIVTIFDRIVKPMLENTNSGDKSLKNVMEGVTNMFTTGFKRMQTAMIDQQLNDFKKKDEKPEDDPGKTQAVIGGVLAAIDKFGEMFMAAKGKQADAMKSFIEADPKFQAAQEDPELVDSIYTAAVEKYGKGSVDELFSKLGFEVPAEQEENTSTETAGQTEPEKEPA